MTERWPQFRLAGEHAALFQPDGGILDIRRGGAVHRALAARPARPCSPHAGARAARHGRGRRARHAARHRPRRAGRAVRRRVEPRPLAQLGVDWPIRLTQEQVTYYATPSCAASPPPLPDLDLARRRRRVLRLPGLRRGRHQGGGGPRGPGGRRPAVQLGTGSRARGARHALPDELLPGYTGPELYTRCCLYDMPPDRDFVLDRVPGTRTSPSPSAPGTPRSSRRCSAGSCPSSCSTAPPRSRSRRSGRTGPR